MTARCAKYVSNSTVHFRDMKWIYVTFVGLLAVGFVYFISTDQPPNLDPFPEALSDEPDALMSGVEITQFDADGIQLYRISADDATYFEKLGRTNISGLSMLVYGNGTDDWRLSADEGIYEEDGADPFVTLNGNVYLTSAGDEETAIVMTTEAMKLFPRRQYVESMSRVSVEKGSSKFHADHFEVDLATNEVRFSANEDSQVELLVSTGS